MNRNVILCGCLAGAILGSGSLSAVDASGQAQFPPELTDSTLRDGMWVWRSGHHIPEDVIERVVRIRKSADKWNLTMLTLSHTRESFYKRQPPQVQADGPYPISVTNGILHIEKATAVLKYSCRFYGELLQFPAVTRTQADTFSFTVSEAKAKRDVERDTVDTWSYTWICTSNPSVASVGSASFVANTPQGKETSSSLYVVEESPDGPALVFRRKEGMRDGEDRIVWHSKYFGPTVYKSAAARLDRPGLQETYGPADDAIKRQIAEWTKQEPNKAPEATR